MLRMGPPLPLTRAARETYIEPSDMELPAVLKSARARALVWAAIVLFLAASAFRIPASQAPDAASFRPRAGETARPAGLPEIGKWMVEPDLGYAHWMGESYEGKRLREPINVIITDAYAANAEQAIGRLLGFCAKAGFKSRSGHSSGYFGWIDGRLYPQVPSQRHHCLADDPFEINNNHGRFFGPASWGSGFLFIGALSREKISLLVRAKHGYVSFDRARDAFAAALVEKAGFSVRDDLLLKNALLGDPETSTGDHDGVAVWLAAPERI
jgi:hypothetical protein